ncbi:MAG: SDR family NAD(P)-dependent oxidoreductase, partial [Micrococcaceae bacterium]
IFSGPTPTADGFETTFQVNHLAPFLLTNLLMDNLLESKASVVNTSSVANKLYGDIDLNDLNNWNHYTPNRAYGNSKLANILFTKALHNKYHDRGLSAVAFHPGLVATNFAHDTDSYLRKFYHTTFRKFFTTAEQGGERLRYFIDGKPDIDWKLGEYYEKPGKVGKANKQAYEDYMVDQLWARSSKMLGKVKSS